MRRWLSVNCRRGGSNDISNGESNGEANGENMGKSHKNFIYVSFLLSNSYSWYLWGESADQPPFSTDIFFFCITNCHTAYRPPSPRNPSSMPPCVTAPLAPLTFRSKVSLINQLPQLCLHSDQTSAIPKRHAIPSRTHLCTRLNRTLLYLHRRLIEACC